MTKKASEVCPRCGGVVTAPSRRVSLEQAITNHTASCPTRGITIKEKK